MLAFVAGAINAGGFLAVRQYTSHVTGMVSAMADNLVMGQVDLVGDGLVGITAFLLGAICCAVMVNFARRQALASENALPLLLGAALILVFGLLGSQLVLCEGLLVPFTVLLLCFLTSGIAGAFGFKLLGYGSTVPLAVLLATLALVPMADDLRRIAAQPSAD